MTIKQTLSYTDVPVHIWTDDIEPGGHPAARERRAHAVRAQPRRGDAGRARRDRRDRRAR